MRALIKNSAVPEDVTLGEVGEPEPAPGQVRVRTQACGLCGSDVHAWRHDRGYEWIAPPVVLGHEAVGRSKRSATVLMTAGWASGWSPSP